MYGFLTTYDIYTANLVHIDNIYGISNDQNTEWDTIIDPEPLRRRLQPHIKYTQHIVVTITRNESFDCVCTSCSESLEQIDKCSYNWLKSEPLSMNNYVRRRRRFVVEKNQFFSKSWTELLAGSKPSGHYAAPLRAIFYLHVCSVLQRNGICR